MVVEALSSDAAHLTLAAAAAVVAGVALHRVDRPDGAWVGRLRSRFLFGVPWGTLLAVGFVLFVYLFVQSGLENPDRPVVIPFRAWSYFYPEGMLWSGFAHASRGHVTGNVLSALVAGTLAEYAYGHFPERGSAADGSLRTNPYVRAFVLVPGAILAFGVVSALFVLGPVIGFSGVVFALWGFALVAYPVGTLAALAGATFVRVVYRTVVSPVEFAAASPSFGPPGWANIAVQGHALGLIAGALVAVWLTRRRAANGREPSGSAPSEQGEAAPSEGTTSEAAASERTTNEAAGGEQTTDDAAANGRLSRDRAASGSALVVFAAVLLFGASRGLWAVYWYLGNDQYELYRAVGLALLVALALVVAVAAAGSDDPIDPSLAVPNPETIREGVASATPAAVGLLLLVAALAAVAGPGIVPNLTGVGDGDTPGESIEVEGYEVRYAEGVENRLVSVIDVEAFGRSTSVDTSGVIVENAERGIWTNAVSRGSLAFWGERVVDVGGTGWRETVRVERTGWVAVEGGPTYRVDATHDGETTTLFTSDSVRAEPRIDGRNVTVAAVPGGFELRVDHEGTTEAAPIPEANASVTLQGVAFVRVDGAVFAERGDTRVRIANRERYEGQRR